VNVEVLGPGSESLHCE